MKRLLIAMTIVILLAGCAAPKIYVNGAPAADRLLILQNPETGIQVFSQIVRLDVTKEGNEERGDLIYLSPGKIDLRSNTRALYVKLRIVNEKKCRFAVWEIYDVIYQSETYPFHIEHKLYSGRLSRKEISVRCPITNVKSGRYRLELRNRKGEPMLVVGNVVYSSGKGGGESLK